MIVVTAGHVDHGKTALLQALTGTNTAHLPEEKKRGLTIDLGYAYLPITSQHDKPDVLGFIDVPGHQRFLSNMLAGVGGIQHALLGFRLKKALSRKRKSILPFCSCCNFRTLCW